jgi:hypothetical protein
MISRIEPSIIEVLNDPEESKLDRVFMAFVFHVRSTGVQELVPRMSWRALLRGRWEPTRSGGAR